jgi:aryl-alcohol dehydrogenase-like predicted oxidoreductase
MTGGEISRAGFGGYRISGRYPEHLAALELALESGCNLVDTAPNYGDGESERVIGKALSGSRREEIFLISKVGYAGEIDRIFFQRADGQEALKSSKRIDEGSLHCLHPRFIEFKVQSSLRNLRTDYLDAVLLHNPEYQLDSEFDEILAEAFATLDRLVGAGSIGQYGVSSNILPLQLDVTLDRLVKAAAQVGSDSKFGVIQFPFNLAEWDANEPQGGRPSLLVEAKVRGIMTVANRPLNARTDRGAIRLVSGCGEDAAEKSLLADFVLSLGDALREQGIDGEIGDLPSVASFRSAMETAVDPGALAKFFDLTFAPILAVAFPEQVPAGLIAQTHSVSAEVENYARKRMARLAFAFVRQPPIAGRIQGVAGDTLQAVACQAVLNAGLDHVLIGMRRPEYVKQFQHLFRRR